MTKKLSDTAIQFAILAFVHTLLIILYFLATYFSNLWWTSPLANTFLIIYVFGGLIFLCRGSITVRKITLAIPGVIFYIFVRMLHAEEDFLGSWIEYTIRKNDFNHDLKVFQQTGDSISRFEWPAWHQNALDTRKFVYSKNQLSINSSRGSEESCRDSSKKLEGDFYIVYSVGCVGGPFF